MSEKKIAEMTWKEIPSSTPMYEILQSIGFPEPMVILKHLNKKTKNGKKADLGVIVSLLWMSKGEIQEKLKQLYNTASRSTEVRKYLVDHPAQAILLTKTLTQINEEPLSVVAGRNMNEWRKLFIEEDVWNTMMKETPITIMDRLMKMFTETDYLNMTIGEYFAKFEAETALEKASIKAVGDKFVEAENKERRMKELEAELKAAGVGNLSSLLLKMALSGHTGGFNAPNVDRDNSKFTS